MKCRPVVSLWATPPQHRVTAAAVSVDSSTLCTGGSNGSIIRWKFSSADSKKDFRPVEILYGHTAVIADLEFCAPDEIQDKNDIRISSSLRSSAFSGCHSSVLSACIDGVLCLWSSSGYCRKRRNLPSWVGIPSVMRSLSMSPSYVCISCCSSGSSVHSSTSYAGWSGEAAENSIDIETRIHRQKYSKLTVVVLDSNTLTIMQTVCHSEFSIGSILSMAVFPELGNRMREVVVVADLTGEICLIDLPPEFEEKVEEEISEYKLSSSGLVASTKGERTLDEANAVSLSQNESLLLLLYSTYLIIKSIPDGHILEKIDLADSSICTQDPSAGQLSGCTFLENEGTDIFTVWNTNGAAILFSVNCTLSGFSFNRVCEIPGSLNPSNLDHYFHFHRFSVYLLRIESSSYDVSGSLLWRPHITVWDIPLNLQSESGKEANSALKMGEGSFLDDKFGLRESLSNCEAHVSSSLVLPEDFNSSLSVIYGFYSGEIQAIRFGNISPYQNLCSLEKSFLGHEGAVLCLAAHKIGLPENNHGLLHVLISGGFDGTIRVWDLDTGASILIMHHHTAPVREIILPQTWAYHPWSDCFVSVGEDGCVALSSLETLNVERIFPGHPSLPSSVAWDSARGYIACLFQKNDDCLYIWDVKTGARERIVHGPASLSMFDHLCQSMMSAPPSSLPVLHEDTKNPQTRMKDRVQLDGKIQQGRLWGLNPDSKYPIKCKCPFPGILVLEFDLSLLMSHKWQDAAHCESVLRFSLSLLHLWDIDQEVDKLLVNEMNLWKPSPSLASGILGHGGALTLVFPSLWGSLELWKHSAEFSAIQSLSIVSLAQRIICSSQSCSVGKSELAAFYSRKIVEEVPDIKPPLLQLLTSFWQDPSEPIHMAARSLFHCAAPRSIPEALMQSTQSQPPYYSNSGKHLSAESRIIDWLESFQTLDWVSCVGGSTQDSMASQIIVAAALSVWYPSIVKPKVGEIVVGRLIKLVMAMNERYSSTAAELLAEGMDLVWKDLIGRDLLRLLADVLFQVECLSNNSSISAARNIRETLVTVLLPTLAMADVAGFLTVIESQLWSTPSDSTVHLVSLNTLLRVIRGLPKSLIPFVNKVVSYVLHTMDHGNSVMRKNCYQSSMATLREICRTFPMVALNETSSRLAVGDAIGDITCASILIYDVESVTKTKILDASGPPGFPSLLPGGSNRVVSAVISVLSFSPDGEGLVAFSEHGLTIRWWSIGTAWWEKLNRSSVPVQCAKLIFVPPWEGFSPSSTRSSIMATISGHPHKKSTESDDVARNIDLSYQLIWIDRRKVRLVRHDQELGCFQL